ncbi:MAG: hypothetical protein PT939_06555 [Aerococcus suis]|nr:hypothetical protein [Aerococcus suis]
MAIPKKTIFKYDISQKYTIPTGVAGRYIGGKPTWTVTHSSGNPNASVDSEINYMTNNYKRAFTHAWVGHNKIVEIANTDYPCWGAGPTANGRAVQIEVTEDKNLTNKQKLQAIDRQAFYIAVQHAYYEIPLSRMYSHADISAMYPNDTNHTDPIAYFKKAGTTWTEYKNQVHAYYGLLVSGGDTRRVVSIADKKGDKAVIKSAEKEVQKNHSKKPDKDGKTKLFKVGDKVKLTDKASHWYK